MAFTETTLVAQIDANGTGRIVTLESYIPVGTLATDVYAVGIIAPYAGRSRWVNILQSRTAAQAWTDIQTALA